MTRVDSNFFAVANNFNFVSVEKPKTTTFIDFSFSGFNVENDYDLVNEILGLDDFDDYDDGELFDDYEEFNILNKFEQPKVKDSKVTKPNIYDTKAKRELMKYYAERLAQAEHLKCTCGYYAWGNEAIGQEIEESLENDPKFQEAKKLCEEILSRKDENDPEYIKLQQYIDSEHKKLLKKRLDSGIVY